MTAHEALGQDRASTNLDETSRRSVRPFEARISRSQILKVLGTGAALATLPAATGAQAATTNTGQSYSFPYYPQVASGTYTPETPAEIISNLLTMKAFDTALASASLSNAGLLKRLNVVGPMLTLFQAITAKEQYQMDWLQSLVPGAAPLTTAFTIDPALAANPQIFAVFASFLQYLYLGAAITAAREMAELGQPVLAKNMTQLAAAEAEDVAAFRALLLAGGSQSVSPPNNKALETEIFLYTRDAIALMKQTGLIQGKGVAIAYPGRDAVLAVAGPMATAVIQRAPNNVSSTAAFSSFATFGGERT